MRQNVGSSSPSAFANKKISKNKTKKIENEICTCEAIETCEWSVEVPLLLKKKHVRHAAFLLVVHGTMTAVEVCSYPLSLRIHPSFTPHLLLFWGGKPAQEKSKFVGVVGAFSAWESTTHSTGVIVFTGVGATGIGCMSSDACHRGYVWVSASRGATPDAHSTFFLFFLSKLLILAHVAHLDTHRRKMRS